MLCTDSIVAHQHCPTCSLARSQQLGEGDGFEKTGLGKRTVQLALHLFIESVNSRRILTRSTGIQPSSVGEHEVNVDQ